MSRIVVLRAANIVLFLLAGVAVALCWWRVATPLAPFWPMVPVWWSALAAAFAFGVKATGWVRVLVLGRSSDPGEESKHLWARWWAFVSALPARPGLLWVSGLLGLVCALASSVLPRAVATGQTVAPTVTMLRNFTCEAGQNRHPGWTSVLGDWEGADACLGLADNTVARFHVSLGWMGLYRRQAVHLRVRDADLKAYLVAVAATGADARRPQVSFIEDGGDTDDQVVVVACVGAATALDVMVLHQRRCSGCEPGAPPAQLAATIARPQTGATCN